jgi:hypothetical protein
VESREVIITAKDSNNAPVEVEVTLTNDNNSYNVTTDSNGDATIANVVYGTYNVGITDFDTDTYSSYSPQTRTVSESTNSLDLVLQLVA